MAKKRNFVGLYVNQRRIEAAYFENEDDPQPEITVQASIEVPEGIITDEGEVAEIDQLSDLLKELWEEANLKVWSAVVVFHSTKAIVRQLRLPHMAASALQQTVLSEAEQFALFRKEDPLVDFFVSDQESDFVSVTFGAVSSEVVKGYNEACTAAGIKLLSCDLPQLAGQRGIAYWYPPELDYWTGLMLMPGKLFVTYWKEANLQNIREVALPEREQMTLDVIAQAHVPDAVRPISNDPEFFEDPHLILGCDTREEAQELGHHIAMSFGFLSKIAAHDDENAPLRAPRDSDGEGEGEGDEESSGPMIGQPISVSYLAVGAGLWSNKGAVASFNLTKYASRKALAGPLNIQSLQRLAKNLPIVPIAGLVVGFVLSALILTAWVAIRGSTLTKLETQIADLQKVVDNQAQQSANLKPEEAIVKAWIPNEESKQFAVGFVGRLRELTPEDLWYTEMEYQRGRFLSLKGGAMKNASCLYLVKELQTLKQVSTVNQNKLLKTGTHYQFDLVAKLARQNP
ncbi:MAG: pilus assembly protein PilM [Candidatus Sericytochromatia bacterium]|nr:pilus assembly protein PilM [Candidatus Sericytochromatia bacterium]